MTEKLDEFVPSLRMTAGVTRQLVKAGIPVDNIPHEWVDVILAGALKWMTSSLEGTEEILGRLKFELYSADSTKEYVVEDPSSTTARIVSSEDIFFARGVIASGEPISFKQLSISDKDKNQCEDCGILSHCLLDVRDPSSGRIKGLCNFCVSFHESPRVNDLATKETCRACTVANCTHNPNRLGLIRQA